MTQPTYILRSLHSQRDMHIFDNLTRALAEKALHEQRVGIRFQIIEQTISEREITP